MKQKKRSNKKEEPEVLKIPASLDDFKYRKGTQDWGLTFAIETCNLSHGKPLMDCMGKHFVLCLVPFETREELESAMGSGIEDVQIDEGYL